MNLFLEDEEDYSLSWLRSAIDDYKEKYNICSVVIDYLELTSSITLEYYQMMKGMAIREDQVLLNLSRYIKNLAKELDLVMIGMTQTNEEARRNGIRDQGAIKGGKAIANKADAGWTIFELTPKEMELIEPYTKVVKFNKGKVRKGKNKDEKRLKPNVMYSVYKNRGGKFKKVKIFGWQDLGNCQFIDLFCTDWYYNPISIDKVITDFTDFRDIDE